jgi:hypothetical protein
MTERECFVFYQGQTYPVSIANLAELRASVNSMLNLPDGSVRLVYEDDEHDLVTISTDQELDEAFAIYEDANKKLTIAVQDPKDEAKESRSGPKPNLDEQFVLSFLEFINSASLKDTFPQVVSDIAAGVLRRSSAEDLIEFIFTKYPEVASSPFCRARWPFYPQWEDRFDSFIDNCTDVELANIAYQLPIAFNRIFMKRNKIHAALYEEDRDISHLFKINQFRFGTVAFSNLAKEFLYSSSVSASADADVHTDVVCSYCGIVPIKGDRFKCLVCPTYDLCATCEAQGVHPPEHSMLKMKVRMDSSATPISGLKESMHMFKSQLKAMRKEKKMMKKAMKHGFPLPMDGPHGPPPHGHHGPGPHGPHGHGPHGPGPHGPPHGFEHPHHGPPPCDNGPPHSMEYGPPPHAMDYYGAYPQDAPPFMPPDHFGPPPRRGRGRPPHMGFQGPPRPPHEVKEAPVEPIPAPAVAVSNAVASSSEEESKDKAAAFEQAMLFGFGHHHKKHHKHEKHASKHEKHGRKHY